MLGYEPPKPNFLNALIAAIVVVMPVSYFVDARFTGHRPGWLYWVVAGAATLLLAYQLYSGVGRYAGGRYGMAASLVPKRDNSDNGASD